MQDDQYSLMRSLEDTHWWYRALRGEVADRVAATGKAHDILDAGCGTGGMLARLRQTMPAAHLTGLDFSPLAVEATRGRGAADNVLTGSVNALPFPAAAFDVVLSLDVLFHAEVDVPAALAESARVLRPGGLMVMNVAAFPCLAGGHDAAVHGARRFTRPQLTTLAEAAGLEITSATYWNFLLSPLILLSRTLSRRAGSESSDLKLLPGWINSQLFALTAAELKIARRLPLPFGSSLLVTCRHRP